MSQAPTSLSLLELVRTSADGDGWDRLCHLYEPLLRRWIRRGQVQDSDADDLVQEVLMVVLRELPAFHHNERCGAFRNWLRTILVNRLRTFWRKRDYRPTATGGSSWSKQLDEWADDSSDTSREWNLEHDRHVMARLLEQLRARFEPKTWAAFRRQVLDGNRADAVARELDMPINSVYAARSRVLRALRREAAGLLDQ